MKTNDVLSDAKSVAPPHWWFRGGRRGANLQGSGKGLRKKHFLLFFYVCLHAPEERIKGVLTRCRSVITTRLLSNLYFLLEIANNHQPQFSCLIYIWNKNTPLRFGRVTGQFLFQVPCNRSHVSLHNSYKVEIQGGMKMNANETHKLRGSWDGGWGFSKFIRSLGR